LHLIVVPHLRSDWQHNYLTKGRQTGHANEQSISPLMTMVFAECYIFIGMLRAFMLSVFASSVVGPFQHTYTHIHTYIHTYIHTFTNLYMHIYINQSIHTYIYTHTYIYAYTYVYNSQNRLSVTYMQLSAWRCGSALTGPCCCCCCCRCRCRCWWRCTNRRRHLRRERPGGKRATRLWPNFRKLFWPQFGRLGVSRSPAIYSKTSDKLERFRIKLKIMLII